MAADTPYSVEPMRLLMTAALGVALEDTTTNLEETEVSCPSKSVTVPCSAEGAQQLMVLAGERWATVDQAYNLALTTRDKAFEESMRAQAIFAQMGEAEAADATAHTESAVEQPPAEEA